jgi:ATP diphosphatase
LFSVVNLARHLDIDPEAALRRANEKFARRYTHLEQALAARGIVPGTAGLELLDQLWAAAKAEIPW